jgi:hypothetical protein
MHMTHPDKNSKIKGDVTGRYLVLTVAGELLDLVKGSCLSEEEQIAASEIATKLLKVPYGLAVNRVEEQCSEDASQLRCTGRNEP